MKIKSQITILTLILSCFSILQSQDEPKFLRVLPAQIDYGHDVEINISKYIAALSLAMAWTNKYVLIPADSVDMAIEELEREINYVKPNDLAYYFKADYILFTDSHRFGNMLRTNLTLFKANDPVPVNDGVGYAYLNYRDANDDIVFDPSLLLSIQRAFADCLRDTNLYAHLDTVYQAYPAPTLAIGSIHYIEHPELVGWNIFESKILSSYDAVQTIFQAAQKSLHYAVFDIETRDAIYGNFNLYGIENYHPALPEEINALASYEVEYYVWGTLKRTRNGAELELSLGKITKQGVLPVKTSVGFVEEDSIEELRSEITRVSKELLDLD